ncbi:damage-inducible protein DinB [Flavisolibacter sp. BT320]|nr:damage-inducible protein DinB [Flavisolibacter longurius]
MQTTVQQTRQVITQEELLRHWQGHRQLTRRVIEAFPEDQFFTFSIGGMRPFAAMVMELLGIAVPGLQEIVSGATTKLNEEFDHQNQKASLLERWDAATVEIDALFRQIPAERFHETVNLFGMYENTVWASLFYFIDNEIHHRAQGYVYLRSLGIEPPPFWDRP